MVHPLVHACTFGSLADVRALLESYPSDVDAINSECDQLVASTSPAPPLADASQMDAYVYKPPTQRNSAGDAI